MDEAIGKFMAFYVNAHKSAEAEIKNPWDLMPYLQEPEWTLEQLQQRWD